VVARAAGAPDVEHDYRPIRDYALIGDCHGAALVSCEGSIDWCCLGRFDADPVFCRILDAHSGGYFSIHPVERFSVTRRYLSGTNILETTFKTGGGRVRVTDFMPVGRRQGSSTHNYVDLVALNGVVRVVEAQKGSLELSVRYRPSVAFGCKEGELSADANRICIERGPILYHDMAGFSVTPAVLPRRGSASIADNDLSLSWRRSRCHH
jgi:GH15 family glucan-1,4-alpha-glucosidase